MLFASQSIMFLLIFNQFCMINTFLISSGSERKKKMADLYTDAVVNFNEKTGKLRHELHGCNSCPALSSRSLIQFDDEFRKMNFWGTRTHDWALWNSGQRMVDTHFIFPLMHLDPADPKNYYFKATDDIIKLAHGCNMRVFYRMGTSIEHSAAGSTSPEGHYNTHMPEDTEKYAEVLAAIIRHYTKGWADGFEYEDMKYWEIWNEPDLGGQMWCGDYDQFAKFFAIVCKRLKTEFPELKIGGPALTWMNFDLCEKILDECKKVDVVPDFISWHRYTSDVQLMLNQPKEFRKFLDDRGFTKTELCMNEWHYIVSWDGVQSSASYDMRIRAMSGPCGMFGIDSACFNLAVLSGWQDGPLDSAYYYGAALDGTWGFRDEFRREHANSYSMKMFGRLLDEADEKVKADVCQSGFTRTVYVLAAMAKNGKDGKMLVTDYRGASETLEIEVEGMENAKDVSAILLDKEHNLSLVPVIWKENRLTLLKNYNGSAAFYITFKN